MASSSGSSPAFPRPGLDRRGLITGLLAALVLPGFAAAAPLPGYLRTALAHFSPNPPAGWSYTITTTRNGSHMVERHDATRPAAARWTLLELQGRAPTAEELQKYARSRPQGDSGGVRANFARDDIEPASLSLVHEDDVRAEWSAGFRESSTGADKMLGRLHLRLIVDKRIPHVSAYVLELKEPYSPVLGVKMNHLRAETSFHPPAADRPALPATQTSSFAGRIFFIATKEDLAVRFTEYAPVPTELSR